MSIKKYIYKNKKNNRTVISDVSITDDLDLVLMGTYQHASMSPNDVQVKIKEQKGNNKTK